MSLATFINKETAPIGSQPIQQEPSGFSDILSKSFTSTLNNFNSNSRAKLIDNEVLERSKAFRGITGEGLDPKKASGFKPFEEPTAQDVLELGPYHIENMREEHEKQYIEQYVQELKEKEPDKYKEILTQEELEEKARKKANLSRREFEEAAKRSSGFTRFTGSLLGGLGATALDPLNIATLPFGAARGAGILRTVAVEAAVNAGAEVATQPFVAKWQKELGQEYGFNEAAENVGFAALFGGTFAGAIKGAKPSAMYVFDKMSKMKNLKPSERLASSYMSKVAHLKEAIPFVRNKTPIETKKHYDSVKTASEAFENGKRVESQNLRVSEEEFLTLDTKPKRGDTQIEKTRLAELERFKKDKDVLRVFRGEFDRPEGVVVEGVKSVSKDPNVAKNFSDTGQIREFIINPDAKIIDISDLRKQILKVDKFPDPNSLTKKQLDSITGDNLVKEARRLGFDVIDQSKIGFKSKGIKANGKLLDEQELKIVNPKVLKETTIEPTVNKDVLEPDFMDRVLDESNSPQFIQAEDINFRALAEENPDLLISLEDGEFRIGELLERFDNDENFLQQITTCTIG